LETENEFKPDGSHEQLKCEIEYLKEIIRKQIEKEQGP
jgi:hypothetical protein